MTAKSCSTDNCNKPHYARGLCADHYTKWRMINNPRRCSVDGCDRAYKGRGLCQKHFDAWKTSPEAVAQRGECSKRKCRKPRKTRGLCDHHYQEWRRSNANPRKCQATDCERPVAGHDWCRYHLEVFGYTVDRPKFGKDWSDEIDYQGMHRRVRTARGPANHYQCVDCRNRARCWSYNGKDSGEIIGLATFPGRGQVQVAYSLDPDYYEPRCQPCHTKFDSRQPKSTRRFDLDAYA